MQEDAEAHLGYSRAHQDIKRTRAGRRTRWLKQVITTDSGRVFADGIESEGKLQRLNTNYQRRQLGLSQVGEVNYGKRISSD